jgi:hypothetical protein
MRDNSYFTKMLASGASYVKDEVHTMALLKVTKPSWMLTFMRAGRAGGLLVGAEDMMREDSCGMFKGVEEVEYDG